MILSKIVIILLLSYLLDNIVIVISKKDKDSRKLKMRYKKERLLADGKSYIGNDLPKFSGRTLDLSGRGEVMLTPDICVLNVAIESKDKKSALTAHSKSQNTAKKLFNQLTGEGIDMKDVSTMNMQLNPIYNWVESHEGTYRRSIQVFEGFNSRQDIVIKIRNLQKVANVLDIIAGTENTVQIIQVSYTVDDTRQFLHSVREEAYQNVLKKAEQMCKLAGIKLGKPISIREDGNDRVHFHNPGTNGMMAKGMMAMSDSAEMSSGVSQGQIKLSHSVYVTFELLL